MESKKITHLVFDFFGTLVNYVPGHFSGNTYTKTHVYLESQGFTLDYDQFVNKFTEEFNILEAEAKISHREFHMNAVGERFLNNNFGVVDDAVLHKFIELYISEWNTMVSYYPGMKAFLKKLKKEYSLSIISNTHYPSLISRNLTAMNATEDFDLVVTSVEHGMRKPDKKIFLDTLKKLNVRANSVLYIGDSFSDDYEGAGNAKIEAILIDKNKNYVGVVENRVDTIFEIEERFRSIMA